MGKKNIYIGTSGWHYDHWIGPYYPKELAPQKFLQFYAQDFNSVEINNTFYHLPSIKAVKQWTQTVDKKFLFSVKASRYVTHVKRFKDPKKSLKKFFAAIKPLSSQIGVILFQTPPSLKIDLERLETFINALPDTYRFAFEFRNSSWYQDEVYALLKKKNMGFCIHDFDDIASPETVTASFVYLRFHGPSGYYSGKYSLPTLRKWAKKITQWAKEGKEVFCYFNNDQAAYAVKNAKELKKILKSS